MAKFSESKDIQQRCSIKFCFLLGKNVKETEEMLRQAYGDDAMDRSNVYRWFGHLKNGRTSIADKLRSGRPVSGRSDGMIVQIADLIAKDRRMSVRMMAEILGISKDTVHRILTIDLGKRKLSARFIPKILTDEQKKCRMLHCLDYIKCYENDQTFIESIVTGDESWIYGYEPETKRQSLEWRGKMSPVKKIARMSKSKVKCMLVTFFDFKGLIHHEFIPEGQTINQHVYLDILSRLFEKMRKKRNDRWTTRNFRILHDNARPHTAMSICQYLAKRRITVMSHPPYSPDLSPCDFFLFNLLKKPMRGIRLSSVEDIQNKCTSLLKSVTETRYAHSFRSLAKRWEKCALMKGDYFEGDKFLV